MKVFFDVFLLFLFVFAFSIPVFFNSGYLIYIFSLIYLITNIRIRTVFFSLISTRIFFIAFLSLACMLFFSCISLVLNGTGDLSIMGVIFNNFAALFSSVIIASHLIQHNNDNVLKLFFLIALLQSFFIILMMFFPSINAYIQSIIRTKEEIEFMSNTYGGIRGLGISGSVAFGLAIIMSLLSFLSIVWFNEEDCNIPFFLKLFFIILLLFVSISAGRTAVLGFVLGGVYSFICSDYKKKFYRALQILIYVSLFLFIFWRFFLNEHVYDILKKYSDYSFQMLYYYLDSGKLSTTSTDALFNMYFPLTEKQIFIGDGYYTLKDGTYYLGTDAGFMRLALFLGAVPSVIFYFLFFIFLTIYAANSIKPKIVALMITILSFSFHYKGEVIFLNVAYMKIIYIYIFSSSYICHKKRLIRRGSVNA